MALGSNKPSLIGNNASQHEAESNARLCFKQDTAHDDRATNRQGHQEWQRSVNQVHVESLTLEKIACV